MNIDKTESIPVKYQTGDSTLREIGKQLGNLTPTMVGRLFLNAEFKVKSLTSNKSMSKLSSDEEEGLYGHVQHCRKEAACEYIKLFREVNGDIYNFIMKLKKLQYITDGDIKIIKEEEIEQLAKIKSILLDKRLNDKIIRQYLFDDLDRKEGNILKLYQCMVSRMAFPNMKRGRPRKIDNEN